MLDVNRSMLGNAPRERLSPFEVAMRVLAVAFRDGTAADRVLRELRRRYALAPDDAAVAPLGSGLFRASTVLAGRFPDELVPEVRDTVAAAGGEVVTEVDERWTRSPARHEQLEDVAPDGPAPTA